MQRELDAAKALAIRAGDVLLDHYDEPAVDWKAPGNPVTQADRSASTLLVEELRRQFPGDGILSEEEPDTAERLSKARIWIVDPLDGTKEFINHNGEFSVMIGLAIDGAAKLGVVYQPAPRRMYFAASGQGAFLVENGVTRPLHVSSEQKPERMTIAMSRSHPSKRIDAIRSRLGIGNAIPMGSLGLKTGLICDGRAHVYLNTSRHTWEWDTCAPEAILREAGGRVTDMTNRPLLYNNPDPRNANGVVATNGVLHDRIVEVTRSVVGV